MALSHSPHHCDSSGEHLLRAYRVLNLLFTLYMHCLIDYTQPSTQVDFITIYTGEETSGKGRVRI